MKGIILAGGKGNCYPLQFASKQLLPVYDKAIDIKLITIDCRS